MELLKALLFFSFVALVNSDTTSKATKFCSPGEGQAVGGGRRGKIHIRIDSPKEAISVYVPNREGRCTFPRVTENVPSGQFRYEAEIDTTISSKVQDCAITHESDTISKMIVMVSYSAIITAGTTPEDRFSVTCDWTQSNTWQVSTGGTSVKTNLVTIPAQGMSGYIFDWWSATYKDNIQKKRGTVEVGRQCSFRFKITNMASNQVKAIKLFDCFAKDGTGNESLHMVNIQGCGAQEEGSFDPTFHIKRKVIGDEVEYKSRNFKCFRFRHGKMELDLSCRIEICFDENDERCKVVKCPVTPPGRGKKRRDTSRTIVDDVSKIIVDDPEESRRLNWEKVEGEKASSQFEHFTVLSVLVSIMLLLTAVVIVDRLKQHSKE